MRITIELIGLSIYDMLGIIPCVMLAVIPFRDRLRFTLRTTILIALMLSFISLVCRIISQTSSVNSIIFTIIKIAVYMIFYKGCVLARLPKLFFVLLIILNYASIVAISFSYFTHLLYPEQFAQNPYSFRSILIIICILSISFPVFYWMMAKKVHPLMSSLENKKQWSFLWFVPATFCLSYYYSLYMNGGVFTYACSWRNMLFSMAMNAGSFFITYIVIRLIEESNDNLQLKTENYRLEMQTIQYENLQSHMEKTRRARHDLRQNMTVIQAYINTHNLEGLQEYLNQYFNTLPSDTPIIYCCHYVINAIIVYYADMAKERGIEFSADIQFPQSSHILDTDAAVLFGNLLENAVEACKRQPSGKPFIRLRTRKEGDAVVIVQDNSYHGTIRRSGDSFLSSKRSGDGIGMISIQKIAEKYHGFAMFDYDGDVFHASVMLYPDFS